MNLVTCYACGHLVPESRPHIFQSGKCYPNWGRFCNSGDSVVLGGHYDEKHRQKRTYCRGTPYQGWNPVGYCENHLALYLQASGRSLGHIRGLPPSPIVPLRQCALGCRGGCALTGKRTPRQSPYNPNPKACWLMVDSGTVQKWLKERASEVAELRTLNGIQDPEKRLVKPPPDLANFETTTRRSA